MGGITMHVPDPLEGFPDARVPCPYADLRMDALLINPELRVRLLATDGQLRKEQPCVGAQIAAGPQSLKTWHPGGL